MRHGEWNRALFLGLAVLAAAIFWRHLAFAAEPVQPATEPLTAYKNNNWAEAYGGFRAQLLSAEVTGERAANSLEMAVECLDRLNRDSEFDAFVEAVLERQPDNWRLMAKAGDLYAIEIISSGRLVAGEFQRGVWRGQGEPGNSHQRDHVRALQLYWQAAHTAQRSGQEQQGAKVLLQMAQEFLHFRSGGDAWKLQSLTELKTLPDFERGWSHSDGSSGAPVTGEGNPVLHALPKSWEASTSDGERWRWLLREARRWNSALRFSALQERAEFSQEQFGVQTLRGRIPWHSPPDKDDPKRQSSILALHTLEDDETIAQLATGIKRFKLPAEHHHVKLLQVLFDEAQSESKAEEASQAAEKLGDIFLNRRQYPRAAEYFQSAAKLTKDAKSRDRLTKQVEQIVGSWGSFLGARTQPAQEGATLELLYRNADSVELTAKAIDVTRLLSDVKAYLRSNPGRLDRNMTRPESIGYSILEKQSQKYLREEVARWRVDLDPHEKHFDRLATIATPLQKPGAYYLTAKVAGGNTSHLVLWVADTAILSKPQNGQLLYFVADAVTGQPIPGATLEMFGYDQVRLQRKPPSYSVVTGNFAARTDADGLASVAVGEKALNPDYRWLVTATTKDGRLAYMGFDRVWNREDRRSSLDRTSAYLITDRPVYRPDQKVHYKAWVQRATYGVEEDQSEFAHQAFRVELFDPKNEKVQVQTLTANSYGGIEGEYEIPGGAPLGVYRLAIKGKGQVTFRVEEYKKPEFEVEVIGPEGTVSLGEAFAATIRAKYYFGSPVSSGSVKYKVTRTKRSTRWYPPSRWDWLYGEGYWWFSHNARWRPDWNRWGCVAPLPPWMDHGSGPPEVVAEGQAKLNAQGEYALEIDTSIAKELHGDSDHSYRIEAEVVDASRRVIVGSGEAIVARQPFKVYVWLDKGHYRAGDTVVASVAARRADGGPVSGLGKLRLLKIASPGEDALEPRETEVRQWELATSADGRAELQIKASEPGRYRLAYEMPEGPAAEGGKVIEGGLLFTVAGGGFDGGDFVFNDIEITPDRRDYQPGEKVRLRLNTNRRDGAVLLFVRPEQGVYPAPRLVRLKGKSTEVELDVQATDSPNFFVEAVTVASGKTHRAVREIAVPPESRVLNLEVVPSAEAYLPGQDAVVKIRITDDKGEPFVGETVLAVYDKSVEYISGGSNVPGIREHFWEWRRRHFPDEETNLSRESFNLVAKGDARMRRLGVFGDHLLSIALWNQPEGPTPMLSSTMGGAPAVAEPALADADARMIKKALTPGSSPAEPAVRTNFADTAFWIGSLETDSDGLAEVKFPMPENLTAWKMRVWGLGHGARVGESVAEFVTRKNLLVRLQTPRFLIERDEVVFSANVHNYLDSDKQVRVRLELDGKTLEAPSELERIIEVPAGADRRVDWRLKAVQEGEAVVRALALTDEESDAMQLKVPVAVHGVEKMESFSGVVARDERMGAFEFTVPEQRRPEQTRLEVRYSPTLAGAMVDSLPYLVDYPHGCTEQTLNRFLPAVLVQRTLTRMGVNLEDLPEQQGKLDPQQREGGANAWARLQTNPVFNQEKLDEIVSAGVRRLTEMQLSDGGWGWFSGYGEQSSAHTTAVVVRGLLVARDNEVAIVPGVIDRGLEWLTRHQAEQLAKIQNAGPDGRRLDENKPWKRRADNTDALVYLVLAEAGRSSPAMRDFLYRDRGELSPYALAMLGVGLDLERNQAEKLGMIVRNLKQYLVTDDENQTAYLKLPGGYWWYWYGSEYEAHAYFLKLLVRTDPESPVAAGLVKYLLANRRHATYWNSTRDTALVIESMVDYLKATGEGQSELKVEVWLDGERRKEVAISAENLLTFDNRFVIEGVNLAPGRHTLELRKQGSGRLYWNGFLKNFSLEDDIRATGLEVRVDRKFYKLTPSNEQAIAPGSRGQVVSQRTADFQRTEVTNLASVASGDLVEVELTIESKNDYEYLILTDRKAAGFEPVDVRSGYNGNELGAYVEFRDAEVNFFLRRLARGRRSVSYRLRAEAPGQFSALPAEITAMYAPDLRGGSDEIKVGVKDSAAP